MRLFGSFDIVHNSTTLPRTFGGVDLSLFTETRQFADSIEKETLVFGGEGTVNFYEWDSTIELSSTMLLRDFAEMTLTSQDYKVTLYSCQLWLDSSFSIGKLEQQPLKVKLLFKPNVSNQVIKMEEL